MPAKSVSGGPSAARTVGPAIPLAIALLYNAVVSPTKGGGGAVPIGPSAKVEAVVCGESVEDFNACHSEYPTGCSASGSYDPYLNLMKNQTAWRSMTPEKYFTGLQDFDQLERQLEQLPGAGLSKSNHGDYLTQLADMGEGRIHGVIGYLYDIKVEGKESSNCQLDPGVDNENVDFHIFIGFDPAVAEKIRDKKALTTAEKAATKKQSVIVEMTPHYRDRNHPEWTAQAVQAQEGQQVKVLGQLMVDNEHDVSGQNCGRKDATANCWRGTVWELHPVTDFEVCTGGSCTQTSAGWTPLAEPEPSSTTTASAGQPKAKGPSAAE